MRSILEFKIYQILISYIDGDDMCDDISQEIIKLLISKGIKV